MKSAFKAGDTLATSAGRDVNLNALTDVTTTSEHHREGRTSVSTSRLDETLRGTTLDATHGIVISAGRDITATAANLASSDGAIALGTGHDITLDAGVENHGTTRDTRYKKSGLFSSKTTKGKVHGNGSTHTDTVVSAADTLRLVAGHDATIQGAQAQGRTVLADVGHDLTITSEQDTGDYASTQWQVGGKVVVGMGASASGSASYGKVDSHYASVTQASGIQAGDGGYRVHVGDTTHLVGGQLASTADPGLNLLDTGNLVAESVHNVSKYNAISVSVSGGSGVMAGGGGGLSKQSHDASSTTQSGIAAGTLRVRNGPVQGELDRNQTVLEANGVKDGFDARKVAERQELGEVAGYVGMRTVGALADQMAAHATTEAEQQAWRDGGANKVLLHGLVGAATAVLGGGNAAQGALGASASAAASGAMADYLADHGIDPNGAQGKVLMELASTAIGGAVGGVNGASTALQGEQYNRQLHPDYVRHLQDQAKAFAEQQCGCDLRELPQDQQDQLLDNATNDLLQTAQRMQDDAFNAKFDGAPLDAAAEAFIQKDDFGEWLGGKYYDRSQATAAEKADPNINGYALYTALNNSSLGGADDYLMAATGYSHDQYYVFARNDYNSGRPQSQALDIAIYQAQQQSGKDFLAFQGKLMLNGMVAGLTGGLGNVAVEAAAGTRVGNILEYMFTTRTGTAATGAVVNAGAQAAKNDGHINLVEVGTSAASGYLGFGRRFWWNTVLGAGAGVVNTEYGNLANGTDDNVWLGGGTGGLTTGIGYGSGNLVTSWLANGRRGYLGPVVWGNFFGSSVSEGAGYLTQPEKRKDEKINGKNQK